MKLKCTLDHAIDVTLHTHTHTHTRILFDMLSFLCIIKNCVIETLMQSHTLTLIVGFRVSQAVIWGNTLKLRREFVPTVTLYVIFVWDQAPLTVQHAQI